MTKPQSFTFLLSFALWYLVTTSCTVALPEFQTAESLEQGEHRFTAGPFSGQGLNASTGVSTMHSYGLTDRWDLNSHVGVARLRIEEANTKYSALTGPKWSSKNQQWAIAMPLGGVYLDYWYQTNEGVSWTATPTLYYSFPKTDSRIKHTLFVRNELSYNFFYGSWYYPIGGYVLRFPVADRDGFLSISGTRGGFYGGIGLDLSK